MSRLTVVDNWILRGEEAKFHAAALALQCGVTGAHLRRYFRQQYGVGLQDWLNEVRLWRAAEMAITGMPAKELAYRLGFADASHLAHCFRRYHGCSITEFQKITVARFKSDAHRLGLAFSIDVSFAELRWKPWIAALATLEMQVTPLPLRCRIAAQSGSIGKLGNRDAAAGLPKEHAMTGSF